MGFLLVSAIVQNEEINAKRAGDILFFVCGFTLGQHRHNKMHKSMKRGDIKMLELLKDFVHKFWKFECGQITF